MGSADWMPRNLDRRVEILFPVENEGLKKQVMHILEIELLDNVKAHLLNESGDYVKVDKRGKVLVNSQEQFCEEAGNCFAEAEKEHRERVFIPAEQMEENEK